MGSNKIWDSLTEEELKERLIKIFTKDPKLSVKNISKYGVPSIQTCYKILKVNNKLELFDLLGINISNVFDSKENKTNNYISTDREFMYNKLTKHFKLTTSDELYDYNRNIKHTFIDELGYKYYLSINNLNTLFRRNGTPRKFFNNNIYTFENINNYFKINNLHFYIKEEENDINTCKATTPIWFYCSKHNTKEYVSWNRMTNKFEFEC